MTIFCTLLDHIYVYQISLYVSTKKIPYTINKLINSVYERALKVIYNDQYSPFTGLRIKYYSTIHQQDILTLKKGIYKVMNNSYSFKPFELF